MMVAARVSGWLFCGFYGDGFMMFLLEEIVCFEGNWNIGFDCLRTSYSIYWDRRLAVALGRRVFVMKKNCPTDHR